MKELVVAKIYAKSILALADEKKVDLPQELTKLTEVINASNDLENVLFMDVFTTDEKKDLLNTISDRLKLSDLTKLSMQFLVEEKRINLLPLLVKEVIVLDDDRKGFLRGTIEGSEEKINPESQEKIEKYIKTKISQSVTLSYKQNKMISAGYKVTVDDLQLDASLDHQLEKFKQSILTE